LAGVERRDAGVITLDGAAVALDSPRDATAHGISIVHQELSVMPNLDVSENIFAGRELVRAAGLVDREREDSQTATALGRLRQMIPVHTPAGLLSLGARQIVEVARTLAHGARILILDEPTSALSGAETESLFEVLADLKRSGVSIVYISHRLHELLHLGDYFTVLRSGKVVGEAPRAEVTRQWIVERMSGRVDTNDLSVRGAASGEKTLRVRSLSVAPSALGELAQSPLHDVSLDLHRGEILGIYGLLGAGRTELLETIAGCRSATSGSLETGGIQRLPRSVVEAIKAGIVLVPEDRQRDGLIPELSIRENIALASGGSSFFSRKVEIGKARKIASELNIAAHDLELPVTALSGGNQQKVLLARCLMRSPSILLLDEPTRGVDAGAKAEIYRILRKLAEGGLSMIFTSSEIEETRALADRVLVLRQGRVAAEFQHDELTDEGLFAAASPRMMKAEL